VAAVGLRLADLYIDSPRGSRRGGPRALSELDRARREVLREARQQQEKLARHSDEFLEADLIRHGHRVAARARQLATCLGDWPEAWDLLALAAVVERDAWLAELRLDDGPEAT
jgi:hypothetical protein